MSFNYDIDGVRSSKTKAGTTIDYTTDKNRDYAQVVLEKQNNQTVASYTYGDDLLSQTIATGTNFYGYDGLGSTKFLTDTNGAITDTYQYDAYGKITSKTGTTDNNYLYTGEQYDRSLNQYYLRARYYNQGVGRFTQMDTWQGRMGNPTTLNKYLYADARPTMYVDPTGQFSLGGMMSAINVMSTLSSVAVTSYEATGLIAAQNSGESFSAEDIGLIVATAAASGVSAFKVFKVIAKKRKAKKAAGNTKSSIGKFPTLSNGMRSGELTAILGWGTKVSGARDAIAKGIKRSDIKRIKRSGLTRKDMIAIRNYYRDFQKVLNEMKRTGGDNTPEVRAEFMNLIIRRWWF